jgi:pimeloyl-ACP methyl ester carboxylesterase
MAISDILGERRTVEVPAGRIEYRERGSGPTLVFAHGAAVNGDLWRRVVPEFAHAHRCIVPDLPLGGHAIALDGHQDLSLFGCARILASFLDALDLTAVTLVANDTGGAISQALVGRWPRRIHRLVLTSCDAFENYPPKAIAYLKPTVRVAPALWLLAQSMRIRRLQRSPLAYGWATHNPIEPRIMSSYLVHLRTNAAVRRDFARLLKGARARDCLHAAEGLPSFDRPALVAWAADDRFFPLAHGRRLAELLPRGTFELVERSRTFIPEDNPTRLVALVGRFLSDNPLPAERDSADH